MTTRVVETACLLLIGNELLSGKTREANLHPLATTLRALGIQLRRTIVVPDELENVAETLVQAKSEYDLVITSGGVGPTHDDVTIDAVAKAFGVSAVPEPRLEALLRRVYADKLTDSHLRMARVPEGAQLEISDEVTWPTIVVGNVWVLPGVPELFKAKLVALRLSVRGPTTFHTRAAYTKLDEGNLKPMLDQVVEKHPDVEVGSYPKWFDPSYATKITLDSSSSGAVDAALETLLALLPVGEPQRVE
jgi:molybdenum cofactor synthesis domain-containing protein